jgi:hypothetical protein
MRLTPENKDHLLKAVETLRGEMPVEADKDTGISATTVEALRRLDRWPGGLLVETPREPNRPESVVKISRR